MTRRYRAAALFAALVFLFSAAFAFAEEEIEIIIEEEDSIYTEAEATQETETSAVFTPSLGSPYTEDLGSPYWTTPMDITDEEAVWNMLMQPITVVDPGKKTTEKSQVDIHREPDENSKVVGEVTCKSQGVRVIRHEDNGWSLIECYSSSFYTPPTKTQAWNILVSGYVKTAYLKVVTPTDQLALVVDKLSQRLYVFQEGRLLTTLLCSTGLVMHNGKKYQPYNETRSGEFLLVSRVGEFSSDRLICSFAIRFNGGDMIHEVPHVLQKDGKTKDYRSTEPKLGTKCSHGCIRVQQAKSAEGINMAWIYNQVKSNNSRIKLIIWEDWQGRQLDEPSPDTTLYYNPKGGQFYHRYDHCYNGKGITFTPFTYGELEEKPYSKLKCCPNCNPPLRLADIREINELYAPGGDHEELLNSLREDYYAYLQE